MSSSSFPRPGHFSTTDGSINDVEDPTNPLDPVSSSSTSSSKPVCGKYHGLSTRCEFIPLTDRAAEGLDSEFDEESSSSSISTSSCSSCKNQCLFLGPAVLIAIGFVDPGNWAANLEAGSRFGYSLLWVLLLASGIGVMVQILSATVGTVTGHSLATLVRLAYPRWTRWIHFSLAEGAIVATDLAEVLGTVIALNLLTGLPHAICLIITTLDTVLFLLLQRAGARALELAILVLLLGIMFCFIVQMIFVKPSAKDLFLGFVPSIPEGSIFVCASIVGSTVMPHNVYLHSAIVHSRQIDGDSASLSKAVHWFKVDTLLSMSASFLVNMAILVVSAGTFYARSQVVDDLAEASELLDTIFGHASSIIFGVALLLAGQSSTITGTMAGETVFKGFVQLDWKPWQVRLFTRGCALIPALVVILVAGASGSYSLLILSQVILSVQLPFALIPLLRFTSSPTWVGEFALSTVNQVILWFVTGFVIVLNVWLLVDAVLPALSGFESTVSKVFFGFFIIALALLLLAFLLYTLLCTLRTPNHHLSGSGSFSDYEAIDAYIPDLPASNRTVHLKVRTTGDDDDSTTAPISGDSVPRKPSRTRHNRTELYLDFEILRVLYNTISS